MNNQLEISEIEEFTNYLYNLLELDCIIPSRTYPDSNIHLIKLNLTTIDKDRIKEGLDNILYTVRSLQEDVEYQRSEIEELENELSEYE